MGRDIRIVGWWVRGDDRVSVCSLGMLCKSLAWFVTSRVVPVCVFSIKVTANYERAIAVGQRVQICWFECGARAFLYRSNLGNAVCEFYVNRGRVELGLDIHVLMYDATTDEYCSSPDLWGSWPWLAIRAVSVKIWDYERCFGVKAGLSKQDNVNVVHFYECCQFWYSVSDTVAVPW